MAVDTFCSIDHALMYIGREHLEAPVWFGRGDCQYSHGDADGERWRLAPVVTTADCCWCVGYSNDQKQAAFGKAWVDLFYS